MDALAEFLYSIPNCSYNQFVNLTALLNFIINGEMFDIAEQFLEESSDVGNKLAVTYTENLYKSQDEQVLHGTYQFENMLLSFVRDGETDKLNAFLTSTAKTTHLREESLRKRRCVRQKSFDRRSNHGRQGRRYRRRTRS